MKPVLQEVKTDLRMKLCQRVVVSCFEACPLLKLNLHPRSRVRPSVSSGIEVDLRVTTKNVPANRPANQLCHVFEIDKVPMTTHV